VDSTLRPQNTEIKSLQPDIEKALSKGSRYTKTATQ